VPICTHDAIHLIGRVGSPRSQAALASLPGSLDRRVAYSDSYHSEVGFNFKGLLDEVRIYDRALSEGELETIANATSFRPHSARN
jgi:hypothetical protein